jgi:hypothetical protein
MASVDAAERAKAEGGACLESYRPEGGGPAWQTLAPAAILMTLGSLFICTAFIGRGILMHAPWLTYVGILCVLMGPILSLYSLVKQLFATGDEYLALLERGLLLHTVDTDVFVRWSDLSGVRWDATGGETKSGALVLERRDDEVITVTRRFGTMKGDALAAHVDEMRRKGSFNLLHE